MTDRFVDNFTPGDGTDGLTWAKAEITGGGVFDAADAAGDRILFDSRHSESTAGALNWAVAGTQATPSQILSVTQSGAAGISSLTEGAIVATGTGVSPISIAGSFYEYGINFKIGVGSSSNCSDGIAKIDFEYQIYEQGSWQIATTHASTLLQLGTTANFSSSLIEWRNVDVKFAATGQALSIGHCTFHWNGGAVISGGTTPDDVFQIAHDAIGDVLIENVDFSNFASTVDLCFSPLNTLTGTIRFRNCKMPASWSGSIGTIGTASGRIEAFNCNAAVGSGENNYSLWVEEYAGNVKHETTIVRTGGASDGVTPISWRMATGTGAEFPVQVLRSPEITVRIPSTGSKTLTAHFVADENVAAGQGAGTGNAFQDNEWGLEVRFLGTADSPQGSLATSVPTVIATPADLSASSEAWTTTGMTTPQKQQISVNFTANEKCVALVTIVGYKASKTAYFCPKLVLS